MLSLSEHIIITINNDPPSGEEKIAKKKKKKNEQIDTCLLCLQTWLSIYVYNCACVCLFVCLSQRLLPHPHPSSLFIFLCCPLLGYEMLSMAIQRKRNGKYNHRSYLSPNLLHGQLFTSMPAQLLIGYTKRRDIWTFSIPRCQVHAAITPLAKPNPNIAICELIRTPKLC